MNVVWVEEHNLGRVMEGSDSALAILPVENYLLFNVTTKEQQVSSSGILIGCAVLVCHSYQLLLS